MSEQNNNCEQCGNNKEPNGECYDCEYTRECGICYERKRWACDGGDFIQGNNCDHRVCVDCSVKIIRCPFCRKSWEFFEDSDGEEVDEDEEEEPEDQDDFENRICGFCSKDFLLSDPHFYSEETDECYCNEECYRKEQEEEECRNCHNENHEWCTGLVTSNEHNGMCHECYSRN